MSATPLTWREKCAMRVLMLVAFYLCESPEVRKEIVSLSNHIGFNTEPK